RGSRRNLERGERGLEGRLAGPPRRLVARPAFRSGTWRPQPPEYPGPDGGEDPRLGGRAPPPDGQVAGPALRPHRRRTRGNLAGQGALPGGGGRGLPGGSSLARLLARRRRARNPAGLPPLSAEEILAWADRFHDRTGRWPRVRSGPIPGTAGE